MKGEDFGRLFDQEIKEGAGKIRRPRPHQRSGEYGRQASGDRVIRYSSEAGPKESAEVKVKQSVIVKNSLYNELCDRKKIQYTLIPGLKVTFKESQIVEIYPQQGNNKPLEAIITKVKISGQETVLTIAPKSLITKN